MAEPTSPPAPETTSDASPPSHWARRYPPLLSLAVAFLIAIVVLPSSLNLPQTNPATTLEFAPVPPDEDKPPPPPGGNESALGLGSSSSGIDLGGGAGPGEGAAETTLPPPPPTPLGGIGKTPTTKRCVGNPPRQSEDPLSPPCVADFSGDNGGATYQGITGDEVKVLVYAQGFTRSTNTCQDPNQVTPDKQYFDLLQPPKAGEHCVVRVFRTWQRYFNERYQTYKRFVHFFVYFSGQGSSAEERKADAADNYLKVKPFAVVTSGVNDFLDDYEQSMARRGVVVFDAANFRNESFYAKFAKQIWGYAPTLQLQAEGFVDYLCTKVAGKPVVDTGNPADLGKSRVYGLIYTTDKGYEPLRTFKDLVKAGVARCGITFAREATFPSAGYVQDNRYPPTYAQRGMADFQSAGVTTIIWASGLETQFSKAAGAIGYRPEWIIAGDGLLESQGSVAFQDQSVWDHAILVTPQTAVFDRQQQACYLAYREVDPQGNDREIQGYGCEAYPVLRQLFTGIQVAGPRLNPASMDKGYHAIPPVSSEDPRVPACFYRPGDYSCVKDQMAKQYSASADNGNGCYLLPERGLRHLPGQWPAGNTLDQVKPDDPCDRYATNRLINPNAPSPNNL